MSDRRLIDQVGSDYDRLEPGEADAWNPVGNKWQLGYRLNLFGTLARALERAEVELADLAVLDLGCGNGRSTRMYLDLGLRPEQLCGLDLRPATLSLARKLNPAIDWRLYSGGALPAGNNWVSAVTVFSSIATADARREVAGRIGDSLPTGGHVFYYDSRTARDWVDSEPIDPPRLFAGFNVVWRRSVGRYDGLPWRDRLEGLRRDGIGGSASTPSLRDYLREVIRPFDEAVLLRKR